MFGEIGNVKFLICRRHPVNAATQYEPRVFSEEEADSIWQSEDIVEFMNRVTPRYIGERERERGENYSIIYLELNFVFNKMRSWIFFMMIISK